MVKCVHHMVTHQRIQYVPAELVCGPEDTDCVSRNYDRNTNDRSLSTQRVPALMGVSFFIKYK